LLRQIDGEADPPDRVTIAPTLVKRDSVSSPG
jgi:DNA-binding LacI/PurR family transcriptional regulator